MSANNTATTPQPSREVDVVIIGAGTAGQNAYRQAKKQTDSILIINEGFWTTTCATVGCMPSKLLIAAAERAHIATTSAEFGITTETQVDGKQVMKRVQQLRDFFTSHVQDSVDDWDQQHKISGHASITAEGWIAVNEQLIKANKIIIATGSQPYIPDGWVEKLGDRLLTSDTVFELADLPESMAVVGSGAIGLELAQSFQRLGVAVTLFNRGDTLAGLSDPVVNKRAIDCLGNELTLELNSEISEVGKLAQQQAFIDYKDQHGHNQRWQGETVLVATGRRNTLDKLGVENLGVSLDEKNRPKDLNENTGQIGELPVYIVGDANAHLPLLHVASDEGFSAGATVSKDSSAAYIRPPAPAYAIVFCEPQIATVGKSLQQLDEEGTQYVIGEIDFAKQGRSRVMGVNCGILRIYGCKETDRVLGASMIAPDAEYIAHILATAVTHSMSVKQLLDAPFYHPTILEGLRTALRDVQDQMHIARQNDWEG